MFTPAACPHSALEILSVGPSTELMLEFAESVAAGFPSPAQDYIEGQIDLNRELVQHPRSTFCVKVRGESMRDAGLADGDILVVDRSIEAYEGAVVVFVLDAEFGVKHFHRRGNQVHLIPANPKFQPIIIEPDRDFAVWGVVTYTLHKQHRR